ncbi:hypothetical protein ERICIV_00590 [Paenibacillus larvae subsp. larvae]|uniref:Uncharacterized protein n=1 Tax=Paenibacillus larvae subsp. larvae TaxID=147375 RepID=A0A2L1U9H6_9BACL|nr:hypothetical protein [Paenibacillus larvae]AQT85457.1 hypothetical protein B1222_15295 [Paenibacillus larvae subsp. pulvifaciens]AQZ47463.1 hypothetical protein B5S25_13640 [Paenibacillus larvae subsp. pulvifaciens]AVF24811.1 hypothetical protein ERICIII_00591 [Paenibacillus larvae subsp. larvae]AVF29571.1 hypothetical protein ERICIV_00590 [Paenibacillus larvae subsp. larvae]MCY7520322.1 hypothetical protein [Paenibacillus larvae]
MDVNKLADLIEHQLLPGLRVESTDPYEPVKVYMLPEPWRVAGTGNYAVVVAHPYYPDWVVKVYAPGRSGWYKEKAVYQRLGQHPSFSWCPYASDPYLILKRMKGQTLYDCIKRGIRIPERVILDIDEALEYARSRGLVPQDLHAKVVYGLPICTLRNFYAGVPDEIIEAAKIDGTGFFGVMRYIILPVSITGFVVVGNMSICLYLTGNLIGMLSI